MTRGNIVTVIICFGAIFAFWLWQTTTRGPGSSDPRGRATFSSPNTVEATEQTLQEGMIDVRSYGAVGDGAADDSSAIQAANRAVPPGGTLLFPPGTYCLGTPVIPKSRVTYKGIGAILKATNPDAIFKTSGGITYTSFEGFTLRYAYPDANAFTFGTNDHSYTDTCVFRDLDIYSSSTQVCGR
jgi:hypothetical protein